MNKSHLKSGTASWVVFVKSSFAEPERVEFKLPNATIRREPWFRPTNARKPTRIERDAQQ